MHGRATVLVNAEDGKFSFPVTDMQFQLDSVKKKGYQVVDVEACSRTYKYSGNPLFIVMETPEQQLRDQVAAERKIRKNLQKQLQEKEEEIEALKDSQTITEEEFDKALQKLYQEQESNELLIKNMAKRYSELDYDQLDEFYRQVSFFIENGELVKADSLLATRGDITTQVADIKQRGQAIQKEKEQIQKAEAVQLADVEEAARRCYSYYETFAAQHLNDTAAYYLELRASLDTSNAQWLDEAAVFVTDYLADYDKGLEYNNKALGIRLSTLDKNHPDMAISYNNIGTLYADLGEYGKASEYLNKALGIWLFVYGEDHPEIAASYGNIGAVYSKTGEDDKAMEYYNKALKINSSIYGENHPAVALNYNNIGFLYWKQGDYEKALEYYTKALEIRLDVLGEDHPDVAVSYNNIGTVYGKQGDYETALKYHIKALNISKAVLGNDHPDVATNYNNVGVLYFRKGDYEEALEYLNKALQIKSSILGENHPEVASCYNNLGVVYINLGDYKNALKSHNKALEIYSSILGEDHPLTVKVKKISFEAEAKMKE